MNRCYSELIQLPTFEERFEYLRLDGEPFHQTFGDLRAFNQRFYTSPEWRRFRREIIVRDNGCDLGIDEYLIPNGVPIYIHHLVPITIQDIERGTSLLLNPENVICTTYNTHQAIHFSDIKLATADKLIERKPNDTCPWKR